MTTTATRTYNPTAATIITDALRVLGVIEEGGSASSDQITDSTPAFEMYVKGLTKYGLNLWTIVNTGEQVNLVASTDNYALGDIALKITDAVYRDSDGNDTTLIPLTREEYWSLGDKDQTGTPTQFFLDTANNASDTSDIYLWPVPDATAAGGTLQVVYQRYMQDIDDANPAGSFTLDVPQEWLETIKYGLATRLAPMYGYPVQERNLLLREYNQMLKESLDWDTEQESIFLRPEIWNVNS